MTKTAIELTKEDLKMLKGFNVKSYESFLLDNIDDTKDGFKMLLEPPFYRENNFKENTKQYEVRQKLIKKLSKRNNSGIYLYRRWAPYKGYLDALDIDSALGISRPSLYALMEKNHIKNELKRESNRVYIKKEPIIKYLSDRHIIPSGYDFNEMMDEVAKLKIPRKGREAELNRRRLEEIINSDEYKNKWSEFLENVSEKERLKVEPRKRRVGEYELFTKDLPEDNFDKYNPNMKFDTEELEFLPQFYDVKYVSTLLGVAGRTVLTYMKNGSLSYYQIGGRKLVTLRDINESRGRIGSKKRLERPNAGRKSKLHVTISVKDFLNEDFIAKGKNTLIEDLRSEVYLKEEVEKKLSKLKKIDKNKLSQKQEAQIRRYTAYIVRANDRISETHNNLMNKYFRNVYRDDEAIKKILKYESFIESEKSKRKTLINLGSSDKTKKIDKEIKFWENKINKVKKDFINSIFSKY